jgi:hypothetical protein
MVHPSTVLFLLASGASGVATPPARTAERPPPLDCVVTAAAGLFQLFALPPGVGDLVHLDLGDPGSLTELDFGFAVLTIPGTLALEIDVRTDPAHRGYVSHSEVDPDSSVSIDVYEGAATTVWIRLTMSGIYVSNLALGCVVAATPEADEPAAEASAAETSDDTLATGATDAAGCSAASRAPLGLASMTLVALALIAMLRRGYRATLGSC